MGICGSKAPNDEHEWSSHFKFCAEFLATFIIVFIGCGSCHKGWEDGDAPTTIHVALAFGLAVTTAVQATHRISGGHGNPVVSLAAWLSAKINPTQMLCYIAAQMLGAIMAITVLSYLVPRKINEPINFGSPAMYKGLTRNQGIGIEALLTFCLVLTIQAVNDEKNAKANRVSPAIPIGFVVTVLHIFGIRYTGAAMNPARAFAPALLAHGRDQLYEHHVIYWIGPIIGSCAAVFFYHRLTNPLSFSKYATKIMSNTPNSCKRKKKKSARSKRKVKVSPNGTRHRIRSGFEEDSSEGVMLVEQRPVTITPKKSKPRQKVVQVEVIRSQDDGEIAETALSEPLAVADNEADKLSQACGGEEEDEAACSSKVVKPSESEEVQEEQFYGADEEEVAIRRARDQRRLNEKADAKEMQSLIKKE